MRFARTRELSRRLYRRRAEQPRKGRPQGRSHGESVRRGHRQQVRALPRGRRELADRHQEKAVQGDPPEEQGHPQGERRGAQGGGGQDAREAQESRA